MSALLASALAGLVAGAVHVWSGPDHLSAVAPLVATGTRRAWATGLRWGLGHSAGVGGVALLSLWLRARLPVDLVSAWGERCVGVVLIAIGAFGLRRALRTQIHTHRHHHDGVAHVHIHVHARGDRHPGAHRHLHAAFGIGTLHGLAGSSHFLGVLPALAFPRTEQAVAYLVAYGAGTVASMIAFAAGVGRFAARAHLRGGRALRDLLATCSAAAVLVGFAWIVL